MRLRTIFLVTTIFLALLYLCFAIVSALALGPLRDAVDANAQTTEAVDQKLNETNSVHQAGIDLAREFSISIYQEQVAMSAYLYELDSANLPALEDQHNLSSNLSFSNHGELNQYLNEEELNWSMRDIFFAHNALLYEFQAVKVLRQAGSNLSSMQLSTFTNNLSVLVTLLIEGGPVLSNLVEMLSYSTFDFNTFNGSGGPFDGNNLFSRAELEMRSTEGDPIRGLADIIDRLDHRIDLALEESRDLVDQSQEAASTAGDRTTLIGVLIPVFAIMALAAAAAAGVFLTIVVDTPLRNLTDAMDAISKGQFETDVPEVRWLEGSLMAQAFHRMVVSLKLLS